MTTKTEMAADLIDGMLRCLTCGQRAGTADNGDGTGYLVHDRTGRVECDLETMRHSYYGGSLELIADLPATTPWPLAQKILGVRGIFAREVPTIPPSRTEHVDCSICDATNVLGIELYVRPSVCTCSDATRPTLADRCREWETRYLCQGCIVLAARDLDENPFA